MKTQLQNKKSLAKQSTETIMHQVKRVTLSAMVLGALVGATLPTTVMAIEEGTPVLEPLDLKKVAAEINEKKLRERVELKPVIEEFVTKGSDKLVQKKGLELDKTLINIEKEKEEPIKEVEIKPEEAVVEVPVVEEVIVVEEVFSEPEEEVIYEEVEVYEEPVYEEPVYEEPVYVEPVVEEPVYVEPVQATSGTHMRVQATMYSQHQAGLSNMTAAGYNLNENPNIIAVNPSIIPFGSVVEIAGIGTYIAGDTGSFTTWGGDYTTGIDIHTNDLSQAIAFGKQFVDIIVYQPGQYPRRSLVDNISEEQAVIPVTEDTKTESVLAEEEIHEMPVVEFPIPVVPEVEFPVKDVTPMVPEGSYFNKIKESVSEEPVIEDVYEEPVIEEVYEEPVIEEVYEEPVYEEVYEEPVYEEVYEEPVYEEVYEEPVIEEVYEEPVHTGGGLLSIAESVIGTPYVWGGKTPAGFDCSGFINYVYKQAYGMDLGSWTGAQQYAGQLISVDEAQAGDLYFWGEYGGDTYHVALATGGGSYIHASQPGTALGYGSIQWYAPQFAIRVL